MAADVSATGGVTQARNNNSSGQHPTPAPTTLTNTNNISTKTECSDQIPSQLPRSRLSVFTPSPMGPDTRKQTFSHLIGLATTNSLSHNILLDTTPAASSSLILQHHPLHYSVKMIRNASTFVLKNGSIISSLVTYTNSVRDTAEKVIASQMDSIASKLRDR